MFKQIGTHPFQKLKYSNFKIWSEKKWLVTFMSGFIGQSYTEHHVLSHELKARDNKSNSTVKNSHRMTHLLNLVNKMWKYINQKAF